MPPTDPGAAGADPENSALARLAAVLHPADPHPDRISSAGDAVALEIVDVARAQRASGLLARALERAGRLEALPEAARAILLRDGQEQAQARAERDALAVRSAGALIARGVPFLLLKGTALGYLTYGDPVLRPVTNVDVLVRPADLDRALEALAGHGFALPPERERAARRSTYYNIPVAGPDGTGPVEIHWSIARPGRERPDVDGLFARRRDFSLGGLEVAGPGAADLLLHQALHHGYHHFAPRLVRVHDVALLLRTEPPVGEIVARARRWGMTVTLALAVLHAEKVYPGAVHPGLLGFARGVARARVLALALRSPRPVAFLRGTERRALQLALALWTVDNPVAFVRRTAWWARRTVRH